MENMESTIKNLAYLLTEAERSADLYWKNYQRVLDKYTKLEEKYNQLLEGVKE